jgi:hypothetical protein
MKKFCLPLLWLSLLSGTAYATREPPLPETICTDGEFFISVVVNRHDGVPPPLLGQVSFFDGDFVEIIARVDGLVRIDGGPNIMWRGDGFHLRLNTSRTPVGTTVFPGDFNGRDDDGNPILTGNLGCVFILR